MTFPIWNSDSEHHININMKNFYLSFAEATIYPIPSQAFCYFQNQWIWKMSPGKLSGPAGPIQPEKFKGGQDDKVDGEDYTGGGVGQFCSSLLSLQLKLPSHLSIQWWWWQRHNPLWSNVTDNYKSLHSSISFLMQRRWQKTFVMKIVIKTFTSLWCNDDDDDDYRNLNSSLMQSPFWHRNCSAEHPIVFASFPKPNYAIKHISLLLIIIPSFIYWLWDLPRVQDISTYLFQAQAPSRRISHEQDRTWKSEK